MQQILFHLPWLNVPVYGYGVMLMAAFIACTITGKRLARRFGLDGELFANATLIALVMGLVGARLSHIFENWSTFTDPRRSVWDNLLNALNIRSGGLTFYGGFILATPCCIWYAVKHKLPLMLSMDIVAPLVMIGLGLGRIGCFLNGCCYGEICSPKLGVRFPYNSIAYQEQVANFMIVPPAKLMTLKNDTPTLMSDERVAQGGLSAVAEGQKSLPVLPTQLYSSFTAFLLAGLLIVYLGLPHIPGRGFALMMMLEGPARFLLEMLRVEPTVYVHHFATWELTMTLSMVLGLAVFFVGGLMWVGLGLGLGKNVKRKT